MRHMVFFWIGLLAVSCASMKTICPCDAPEVIVAEGKEISISAEVARRDVEGKGKLKIQVWLTTTDKSTFPNNLTIGNYYIRPSDLSYEAYEGSFEKKTADLQNGLWMIETALGPDWKKGEPIDVAVQLIDSKGKTLFIKKDKVEIQ